MTKSRNPAEPDALGEMNRLLSDGARLIDQAAKLSIGAGLGRQPVRHIAYALMHIFDAQGHIYDRRPELIPEFLRALAVHAGLTLHVKLIHGTNTHHIIEAIFKGLGRTLAQAVAPAPRRANIPSTKGVL